MEITDNIFSSHSLLLPGTILEDSPKTIKGKILIIDDEEGVRETASDQLEFFNIGSLTAENGERGIEIYKNNSSDIACVLLDLSMPGMGGEAALHALRQINPDVKIIISSGYSASEISDRIKRDRLTSFLQKPYHPDTLIKTIQQIL